MINTGIQNVTLRLGWCLNKDPFFISSSSLHLVESVLSVPLKHSIKELCGIWITGWMQHYALSNLFTTMHQTKPLMRKITHTFRIQQRMQSDSAMDSIVDGCSDWADEKSRVKAYNFQFHVNYEHQETSKKWMQLTWLAGDVMWSGILFRWPSIQTTFPFTTT